MGIDLNGGSATPPTPMGLVAAAVSSTQINLTWPAATDHAAVAGYRVERCAGTPCTSFSQVATLSAPSYSDTGLASQATYRYQVRAVDAGGNLSSSSNIASATTLATIRPASPRGLVVR